MNPVMAVMLKRTSARAYEERVWRRNPQGRAARGRSMRGAAKYGQPARLQKFSADFTVEMTRSARLILKEWMK